jgi:hypothetical protein
MWREMNNQEFNAIMARLDRLEALLAGRTPERKVASLGSLEERYQKMLADAELADARRAARKRMKAGGNH